MDLDHQLNPIQRNQARLSKFAEWNYQEIGHTNTSRATLKPFFTDTQTSKINELKYPYYELKHPYQKGMFISISSHKLFYDKLISNFKRQYQSVLKAIGINEIKEYLSKEAQLEEIKEKISIKTRQYAKRQSTWARGNMMSWNKLKPQDLNKFLKKF